VNADPSSTANPQAAVVSGPAAPYDWEGHYQRGELRWDKGGPAPGLVDFLAARPRLPRGTVLVPGCGTGHDVRAWARAGWRATGLDVAPTAVRMARERTLAAGLTADFRPGDFLSDPPFAQFDWVFEHTLFCAIDPALRGAYARAVPRWLRPGGHFLAIHYLNPEHPDGPPWGVTRAELLQRFALAFEPLEEWVPRSYPNRVGRELMLLWHRR
jgi:SAM-dependent methyltransferase